MARFTTMSGHIISLSISE